MAATADKTKIDPDAAKKLGAEWDKAMKKLTSFLSDLDKTMSDAVKQMSGKDEKQQDKGEQAAGGLQGNFKTASSLLTELGNVPKDGLKGLRKG